MLETLSLALATPIAKIVLDKFYEGCGSKLGEKAIALATAPIEKLGKLVWSKCLKIANDPTQAQQLLQAAADGSEDAQKALITGVNQVLDADDNLKKEVEHLATEIHQHLNIAQMNGGEVWNVFGGKAEKNDFKQNTGPIYKDSVINHNYGEKKD